jgi:hypothetical protein
VTKLPQSPETNVYAVVCGLTDIFAMIFPVVVMALPPVDVPQPPPILVTAACSPRVPELSYRNLLLPLPPVTEDDPMARLAVPPQLPHAGAPAPPDNRHWPLVPAPIDAHEDDVAKYGNPPAVPATVSANVPEVVTGEPLTLMRPPVNVSPTLVTVPLPDPQLIQLGALVPFDPRHCPADPAAVTAKALAPE